MRPSGPSIQFPGFLLATQLNLRWHQQDWLIAGVDDREQHDYLLAAVYDFADPSP
jgi:hypothetical protein